VFRLIIKINGRTTSEGRGCNWHKATIMSFEGIISIMG
jgi:hypothetical protein